MELEFQSQFPCQFIPLQQSINFSMRLTAQQAVFQALQPQRVLTSAGWIIVHYEIKKGTEVLTIWKISDNKLWFLSIFIVHEWLQKLDSLQA